MTNDNRLLGNIEMGLTDLRRDICRLEAKIDGLTERFDKRLVRLEGWWPGTPPGFPLYMASVQSFRCSGPESLCFWESKDKGKNSSE